MDLSLIWVVFITLNHHLIIDNFLPYVDRPLTPNDLVQTFEFNHHPNPSHPKDVKKPF